MAPPTAPAPQEPDPNPLAELHAQAEAETQPWAVSQVVTTFGEPAAEYAALHKGAGLVDAAERAVIRAGGKDRLSFLNNLVTCDLKDLPAGGVAVGFLLNLKGRVVADLRVVQREDDALLVVERRLAGMLAEVFEAYRFAEDASFEVTDHRVLSLHGPRAGEVLADAADDDAAAPGPLAAGGVSLGGSACWAYRHDDAGPCGLHVQVAAADAAAAWSHLTAIGGSPDPYRPQMRRLRPTGWAALNTRRIEAGRPVAGVDYATAAPSLPRQKKEDQPDGTGVLPAETGAGVFDEHVSLTKGCYLGQEVVARLHARGVAARRIVGLRMNDDDALPVAGAPVTPAGEHDGQIGVVTSSTVSPILSRAALCLATVKKSHYAPGTALTVPAEGEFRGAKVADVPFVTAEATG